MSKNTEVIKILAIDDDAEVIEFLEDFLSTHSRQIYGVTNPATVKEDIDMVKPDIIICDLSMPKVSGVRLYRDVTSLYPNIPFIFLSGLAQEEVDARFLGIRESTNCYFLSKSSMNECLEETISSIESNLRNPSMLLRSAS